MRTSAAAHPPTHRRLALVSFAVLAGLLAIGLVVAAVVFAWPDAPPPEPGITVPAASVPAAGDDPVRVTDGKFWLVHLLPGEGIPTDPRLLGGVPQESPGGLIALYWRDPHLGCTVVWRPSFNFEGTLGWFRNPCHGETYTKAGIRVFGPAPRSLDTMELRVDNDGSVRVFPERITLGGPDNASRVVPYP